MIAAALAQIAGAAEGSGMLLLDEPTARSISRISSSWRDLLRDLQRRRPMAIVVSTHDLNFAAGLCRTLVLLKTGEVLAAGPTEEVLTPAGIRALYGVEADVAARGDRPSGRRADPARGRRDRAHDRRASAAASCSRWRLRRRSRSRRS